jgi:group I intron endonuclease
MLNIYFITNKINGKIYVGLTSEGVKRWNKHLKTAAGGPIKCAPSYSYIHKAINKYGADNFSFDIIEEHQTIDELKEAEIFWISYLKQIGVQLYNLTDGGDGILGYKYTDAQKQALSDRMKGIFAGDKNPFFGQKHTDETKQILSASMTKRQANKEFVGSKHAHPKLNEELVAQIRKQYYETNISQNDLAKEYDVDRVCIQSIVRNKQWTHIDLVPDLGENLRQDKLLSYWDEKCGLMITHHIECEFCHKIFDIEQREKNTRKLPRFCGKTCKNAALSKHSI